MLVASPDVCPWPTTMFGRPTMLEPIVPRGDTECTLGCISVVPDPGIAPTGLVMNEFVFACFVCRILSIVLSMKTRLFFIVSAIGEFDRLVFYFSGLAPIPWLRPLLNEPESPLLPLP